jgi:hypothetical protein
MIGEARTPAVRAFFNILRSPLAATSLFVNRQKALDL